MRLQNIPKIITAALLAALLATPAAAGTPKVAKESCRDLVGAGWDHMPDVTDYVLSKPGSDKLGFASPCHIDSLVFSQCWLEPRLSVKQAIGLLLAKAKEGKELPDMPVCGA